MEVLDIDGEPRMGFCAHGADSAAFGSSLAEDSEPKRLQVSALVEDGNKNVSISVSHVPLPRNGSNCQEHSPPTPICALAPVK